MGEWEGSPVSIPEVKQYSFYLFFYLFIVIPGQDWSGPDTYGQTFIKIHSVVCTALVMYSNNENTECNVVNDL